MVIGSGKSGENEVVATFPVAEQDEIMLVTDGGQLIRCPVQGKSGRSGRDTRGVTIFRLGKGERVVSVARLADVNGNGAAGVTAANAGAAQDG